jgi:hypothetical protein
MQINGFATSNGVSKSAKLALALSADGTSVIDAQG